jgi:aspartyl-tRNA synthetase
MIRTHEAGTLRATARGERVVLAGWVANRSPCTSCGPSSAFG